MINLLLFLALQAPDSTWDVYVGKDPVTDHAYLSIKTTAVAPIHVNRRVLNPVFTISCSASRPDPFVTVKLDAVVDGHRKEKNPNFTRVTERLDQQKAVERTWYITRSMTTISPDKERERLREWSQGTTLLLEVPMYPGTVGLMRFSMVGLRDLLPKMTEVCGTKW